ncbi:guanylyl cyclase [Tsukamurella sp. M9C]|uniref:adenylate/guanylate cyclase domain-containing protein n=1 Tax=Tsukamurella TaxID=2060 RepID=UPI001CCD94E3|nr:adenylate/guanylate cyclase domain-containing protein [Tsukamurella sp. M9C]MCA0154650.1 guanylyl cyclase [Tsukamurella sp. M9C]
MTTPEPDGGPRHGHHHGARPELDGLEQVEVAVAFVDLAGYSVLTEMCGDQEAAELAIRLAEQARRALHPQARLVKTIGDAVMLTAETTDAMLATITTLAEHAADEDGFLALRAGIHHGTAVRRDGDLFGHAVNIAARITALAGAGHAVITDPLLPAATRAGVPTAALGPRSLRNISAPIDLHSITFTQTRHPHDPICGARIDPATAPAHRHTDAGRWWFCSADCAGRFDRATTTATPSRRGGR